MLLSLPLFPNVKSYLWILRMSDISYDIMIAKANYPYKYNIIYVTFASQKKKIMLHFFFSYIQTYLFVSHHDLLLFCCLTLTSNF